MIDKQKRTEFLNGEKKTIYNYNKGGNSGYESYNNTYKKDKKDEPKSSAPHERTIPLLTSFNEKNLEGYKIICYEGLCRRPVQFHYDGKVVTMHDTLIKSAYEVKEVYDTYYTTAFLKLKQALDFMSFTIYAEMFENSFIFYDLYVNSNWILFDDFKKITEDCGLVPLPILYEGEYSRSKITDLLDKMSWLYNSKVTSIIVRKYFDNFSTGRTIAKLIGKSFGQKFVIPLFPTNKGKISDKKIQELIDKYVCNNRKEQWTTTVFLKNFTITKANLSMILPWCVERLLDLAKIDISNYAKVESLKEEDVKKRIKKLAPKTFRKLFNI